MKKQYEKLKLHVVFFEAGDVLTNSNPGYQGEDVNAGGPGEPIVARKKSPIDRLNDLLN